MKRAFRILTAALFFFFGAGRSAADWIEATDFEGGTVMCLAVVGNTLIAGTENCGVYVSADMGEQWAPAGLPGLTVRALAARDGELFAGTDNGVFHSTDGGATWNAAGLTDKRITALGVTGTNLVAGIINGGVAFSTDDGRNWNASGLAGLTALSFFVSGNRIVAGTQAGVAISTDGGVTWNRLQTSMAQTIYPYSFVVMGQYLFAGTYTGVFVSTDGGDNWSKAGLSGKIVTALGMAGSRLFAAVYKDGVYISTQGDTNWTPANKGLTHRLVGPFARIGENIFTASDGGGVFRSTDAGTTWTGVKHGLDCVQFLSLAVSGDQVCFAGTHYTGVFVTQDGGLNWTPAGLTDLSINALIVQGRNVIAGTSDGVFRSHDNGATWDTVGLAGKDVIALAMKDQDIIAGLSYSSAQYSTNNGRDWNSTSAPFRTFTFAGANLLGGYTNGVRLSIDHGATWDPPMLEGKEIRTLALIGRDVFAGTSSGPYVSADKGLTWDDKGLMVSGGSLYESHILFNAVAGSDTSLFAGTDRNGVLHSTDNGAMWSEVNRGLSLMAVDAIAVSASKVFAAGAGGLWRRKLSDLGTSVDESPNPAEMAFHLGQNYPNPFNSTTRIDFRIRERGMVTLKVFDTLGREAATVVSEVLSAGSHSAAWNAGALSSGVYFYRLRVGNSVESKKMMLMK